MDYAFTDVAAECFDAGVRLGGRVHRDMVAARSAPDLRMGVAASPESLARRLRPTTPQDLTSHRCIDLRLPSQGGLYAWESANMGEALYTRADGQTVFNNTS